MKIILYIEALITALKNKFEIERIKYNKFPKIVWIKAIKHYIVFCAECGEYICKDGLCSNPICPEKIRDENYES